MASERTSTAMNGSVDLAFEEKGLPISTDNGYPDAAFLESDQNPHNWTTRRKWVNVGLVAAQATLSPVCSTLLAVGAPEVDREFGVTSSQISSLPVAVFVLGLGLGPLYLAPLSEMFGRRIVYIISFGVFCLLNVGCALVHNEPGLIVLRLFAGLAGRYVIFFKIAMT